VADVNLGWGLDNAEALISAGFKDANFSS